MAFDFDTFDTLIEDALDTAPKGKVEATLNQLLSEQEYLTSSQLTRIAREAREAAADDAS